MGGRLIDRELLRLYVMIPDQFRDEELRSATFRSSGNGAALWSGGRAAVFQAQIPSGLKLAVRVSLTTDGGRLRVPYLTLAQWAQSNPMPCLARTQWVDSGLVIDGVEVSLLKMEWIDGLTLDEYIDDCVSNGRFTDLLRLAEDWRSALTAMGSARFAHGDLHAQNIMITHDSVTSHLRFVDYDSLWLPGVLEPPSEIGHQAYQHPSREWGEHMDAFGASVVYLSLRAVAAQPLLWRDLHRGDMTLIVEESDLRGDDPRGVWTELAHHPDPIVRDLSVQLRRWCDESAHTHTSLDRLLDSTATRGANRWAPPVASSTAAVKQQWPARVSSDGSSAPLSARVRDPVQGAGHMPPPGSPQRQTWPTMTPGPLGKQPSKLSGPTKASPVPKSARKRWTRAGWFIVAIVIIAVVYAMGR